MPIKILILDIENYPNEVDAWGLFKQNISIQQINNVGRMICFASKWLGEDEVSFFGQSDDISRKIMLDNAWKLLDQADAVIHYNGINFDRKIVNTEFIKEGYSPPSPCKDIDLLREVKKNFRLPSNKLDFVLQYFGIGQKVKHEGHELWQKVRAGDKVSWDKMEEYNKGDVIPLEMLYNVLRPWIKIHPNVGLYIDTALPVCRVCGSDKLVKKGKEYTQLSHYQRYKCKECGSNLRGRLNNAERGHLTMGVM